MENMCSHSIGGLPLRRCTIKTCNNNENWTTTSKPSVSYHYLPAKSRIRRQWLETLEGVNRGYSKSLTVCSEHFLDDDDFETQFDPGFEAIASRRLKPDAVPSKFLTKAVPVKTYEHNNMSPPQILTNQLRETNKKVNQNVTIISELPPNITASISPNALNGHTPFEPSIKKPQLILPNGVINNSCRDHDGAQDGELTEEKLAAIVSARQTLAEKILNDTTSVGSKHCVIRIQHKDLPDFWIENVVKSYQEEILNETPVIVTESSALDENIGEPDAKRAKLVNGLIDPQISQVSQVIHQPLVNGDVQEVQVQNQIIQEDQIVQEGNLVEYVGFNETTHDALTDCEESISATRIDPPPATSNGLTPESLIKELNLLKNKNQLLRKNNSELKAKMDSLQNVVNILNEELKAKNSNSIEPAALNWMSNLFSRNQIDLLLDRKKTIEWTESEIFSAFRLRYLGPKCYTYLEKHIKYPFPNRAVLRKWVSSPNFGRGVCSNSFKFLELYTKSKFPRDRTTVLIIGQVPVKSVYEYDSNLDEIVGPHTFLEVIVARGLHATFKQPIYIGFDGSVNKSLLDDVIKQLDDINYDVVGIVLDCNEFQNLWIEFQLSATDHFINHPTKNYHIYIFPDVSSLVRSIYILFVNSGFILTNNNLINTQPLFTLIDNFPGAAEKCGLKRIDILAKEDNYVELSVVADVFSTTVARVLRENLHETVVSNFLETISKWFNLMQPNLHKYTAKGRNQYGLNLPLQNKILDEMLEASQLIKIDNNLAAEWYQAMFLVSIKSIQELFKDMSERYKIRSIYTWKLSSDTVDSLLSELNKEDRTGEKKLTPLEAIQKIKSLAFLKTQQKSKYGENFHEVFVASEMLREAVIEPEPEVPQEPLFNDSLISRFNTEKNDVDELIKWIPKQFQTTDPNLYQISANYSNADIDVEITPSYLWLTKAQEFDQCIEKYHEVSIQRSKVTKNIIDNLAKENQDISYNAIRTYVIQRILIKLKHLNIQLENTLNGII